MTTPTPTAQSSACADAEVTAGFSVGSEKPVSEPLTLTEWRDEAMCAREQRDQFAAELAVLAVDERSAREDLADMTRQRDAALRQLAKAVEILTDIQARVRGLGV